jgi:hypothetical protein
VCHWKLASQHSQYSLTIFYFQPLQSHYMELSGMLTSARQACAHSSVISLENLHRFNLMLERELEREREKKLKREGKTSKTYTIGSNQNQTREGLFRLAVSRAREFAKVRMRVMMNQFQNGDQELLECPVCFEVVGEQDITVPACAHLLCSTCTFGISGRRQLHSRRHWTLSLLPRCHETV